MDEVSPLTLANERMSILEACRHVGMFDVSEYGKQYCPFGDLYHPDDVKAMRVYPSSNSAYCFAGCGYFNPVKLIAMSKDFTEADAAENILELTNYVPPDIESRWAAAVAVNTTLNTDYLADALKVACERMDSGWETLQLEADIATRFRQCLGLLPKVRSEEDAIKWLSITKSIMQTALGDHRE